MAPRCIHGTPNGCKACNDWFASFSPAPKAQTDKPRTPPKHEDDGVQTIEKILHGRHRAPYDGVRDAWKRRHGDFSGFAGALERAGCALDAPDGRVEVFRSLSEGGRKAHV